MVGGRREVKLF